MNHLAAPTACGGSAPSPPTTTESPVSGCANPKWKGDSFCDDGNNNAACQFDGGDCCNQQGAGGIPWDNWCEVSDL